MSNSKDSIKQTIIVGLLLCIVCSVIVSSAAVILKPIQTANKVLDKKKNVLAAAGMLDANDQSAAKIDETFAKFSVRFVELSTGKMLTETEAETLGLDANTYNQRKASKDPKLSVALDGADDIAKISRLVKYAAIYMLESEGKVQSMVLPVHGYGLWGTLYGFIALEGDANTVVGLGFYEHKETPGLGAEVDNPDWKALWPGKKVYGENGKPAVKLVKGSVDHSAPASISKIDALSGATLTSQGVEHLVNFWLSDKAYGLFLKSLKSGGAK
jgi:Na+-transporting NADH:ubiquinone oxidoreductase subunit C